MDVALLLDGDFTRRVLKRKLAHEPTVADLERFCRSLPRADEVMAGPTLFYDCPPFAETRRLPVSRKDFDFRRTSVYAQATAFQADLKANPFFRPRMGHLSFDGWVLKETAIKQLLKTPRPLSDTDFEPRLSQKQVDLKIGIDVAKLSIKRTAGRILLATSDADFIPAIEYARTQGLEVVLITDAAAFRRSKGVLVRAFNSHRLV